MRGLSLRLPGQDISWLKLLNVPPCRRYSKCLTEEDGMKKQQQYKEGEMKRRPPLQEEEKRKLRQPPGLTNRCGLSCPE